MYVEVIASQSSIDFLDIVDTNFAVIGRQLSLPSNSVQTTRFYGERFKIYHVQNFVRIFLKHRVYARAVVDIATGCVTRCSA